MCGAGGQLRFLWWQARLLLTAGDQWKDGRIPGCGTGSFQLGKGRAKDGSLALF